MAGPGLAVGVATLASYPGAHAIDDMYSSLHSTGLCLCPVPASNIGSGVAV